MRRIATVALVAGMGVLYGPSEAMGQDRCGSGREPAPWLGIRTFHCQGGTCMVRGLPATTDTTFGARVQWLRRRHPLAYSFSVEPRLWEIAPDGPAVGKVREGDVLVAVDGHPITTTAGGMRLATAEPEVAVELTLRRDGQTAVVAVVPELSCTPLRASAGPDEMPWTLANPPRDPVAPVLRENDPLVRIEGLGLTLLGAQRIEIDEDGDAVWWFSAVPTIAAVDPGSVAAEAGIRAGEELVTAGGEWVTRPEGIAALLDLARGREGQLIVRFDNRGRVVRIEAR